MGYYPPALQQKTILNCLTIAEFTLSHAHVFAEREDILNTIGCLTKIAFVLLQSLFALNLEYFFGDISNRLRGLLALPMRTRLELQFATQQVQILWKETVHLAGVQYVPKFGLTD